MIPKVAHVIWLGRVLPNPHAWRLRAFRDLNPDWQLRLWTEGEIDGLPLVNKVEFEQSSSYSGRSNVARYEILLKNGGVYFDTDVVWNKSMSGFLPKDDSRLYVSGESWAGPNNSVMACAQGHTACETCVDLVRERTIVNGSPNPSCDVTGPGLLKQLMEERPDVEMLGRDKVTWCNTDKKAYAIHLRENSWMRRVGKVPQ